MYNINKPAKSILNTPYPQSDHDPKSEPNLGLIIGDHEITFPWQLKSIYEQVLHHPETKCNNNG